MIYSRSGKSSPSVTRIKLVPVVYDVWTRRGTMSFYGRVVFLTGLWAKMVSTLPRSAVVIAAWPLPTFHVATVRLSTR